MTHKLTHTPNYLLVVDDSDIKEIKEGDFLYSISNKLVVCANKGSADDINSKVMPEAIHKKIIAHLPLNNSSILQGVDLLPPLEDDVKKLAKEYIDDEWQKDDDAVKFGIKVGYVQGYNKAKEKYRFTEEDMRKAYLKGATDCHDKCTERNWKGVEIKVNINELKELCTKHIQSLSQSKMPTHFECEMEIKSDTNQCDGCRSNIPVSNGVHFIEYPSGPMVCQATKYTQAKTFINSQNQTVLAGKYLCR